MCSATVHRGGKITKSATWAPAGVKQVRTVKIEGSAWSKATLCVVRRGGVVMVCREDGGVS